MCPFQVLLILTLHSLIVFCSLEVLKKQCDYNPQKILDVGANVGHWTQGMKKVFPSAKFVMIEGNEDHKSVLEKSGVPFIILLVGSKTENITFYKFEGTGTGNSIYRENTASFKNIKEITKPIDTIDNIVIRYKLGTFDFIKLDIQGNELNALKGAISTLRFTEVLLVEIAIMNYNEGSPKFFDVFQFLNRIGYAVFDISEMSRDSRNMLVQIDVIWIKKESKLWDKKCTNYPRPNFNLSFNRKKSGITW